jgi:hypothetical protein
VSLEDAHHLSFREWIRSFHGPIRENLSSQFMLFGCNSICIIAFAPLHGPAQSALQAAVLILKSHER